MSEPQHEVVVDTKEDVAQDVVALTLLAPDGAQLPPWRPGAHIDVHLPGDLVRQFSLCGDPADRSTYRIAVLREPEGRGGSAAVHDKLAVGDTLRLTGPRNHFALVESPRYLFIAGGIGITPILPMIAAAQAGGADWQLVYGGRKRASMAFLDELVGYGQRVAVRPQDEHGLLDLDLALGLPRPETTVYCCGPEPLLRAVEKRCAPWPGDVLHVERFAPKPIDPGANRPIQVELARTGRVVEVSAEQSILHALEADGVPVLSSCQEGTCGTCETGVLEGEPEHRDSVLSPAEQAANDVMMICVSRACSKRLVLDL